VATREGWPALGPLPRAGRDPLATETKAPPVRVLVVDDEQAIRDYLCLGLRYEGFEVRDAENATAARAVLHQWDPQVVILDVVMPGEDGFSLGRTLREGDAARLLIFLTARDAVDDRVKGLNLGADDYLVKPFEFRELVARIRTHLRRLGPTPADILNHGPLSIDLARHKVILDGAPLELSLREFDLLCCFLRHAGQVLSKRTLLDRVWGYDFYGNDNIVEQYVRYLREKLGEGRRDLITTVRGVGYRLGD